MRTTNESIDQGAPAFLVVNKWPSLQEFARDLGKSSGTVYRWLESGFIPNRYHQEIVDKGAARKPAVRVKAQDFVDMRITRTKPE